MPRAYPRIGAYVGVRSGGAPLVKADGTLDTVVCQQFARFPQVALDMNALLISPGIIPELVRHNPNIEVSGYHLMAHWYLGPTFTPQPNDKSFDADWHNAIKSTNGFIAGAPEGFEVNWGQNATSGELISLLVAGLQRLRVKGFFGDFWNAWASWAKVGNSFTDQVRVANMRAAAWAIRAGMGYRCRIYGNGAGADQCGLDGTLIEGFPTFLTTGSFSRAIQQKDGDWLKSEGQQSDKRMLRYMLGTACLTGATTSYGKQEVAPDGQPWPGTWWYDEYSVTPNGLPDSTGACVGWLGQAAGAYWTANGLHVRQFEHGLVVVNASPGPLTLDMLYPRWKRIGTTAPLATVLVPASDAVFLWGD